MFQELLKKFYAASISIDPTGAMLVASTRDRFMAWASLFCFLAAISLIIYLLLKKPVARKVALCCFIGSLIIPVYIIPTARSEYIKVSENQIIIDSSNWIKSDKTTLSLQQLQSLREIQDGMLPGNLMGDPSVVWHFSWEDGSTEQLVLNDFFNAHRFVVAHYIRDRGNKVHWLEKPVDSSYLTP